MMSNNKELNLKISVEALGEHLCCPVCMNRLKHTYMTPCGHRYCESCITQWISRNQRCPCCNTRLNKDQLIRDALFDNLIESITKEENAAEAMYFDQLILAAEESAFNNVDDAVSNGTNAATASSSKRQLFSPIEKILKDHLKQSLISHEKYFQDLLCEQRRKEEELNTKLLTFVEELGGYQLSADELSLKIKRMEEDTEIQRKILKNELSESSKLVAEAYDRYLTEHIPDLSILPVTVGVSLLNRGLQLSEIVLKPQDSLDELQTLIKERLRKTGDDIVEFSQDIKYLCFSPFAKRSLYEMKELVADIVEHDCPCPSGVLLLPGDCRPVIQLSIKPGSEIVLYGMVRCESDRTKQCFAVIFGSNVEGGSTGTLRMDYFQCKDCVVKWICRPCMDACHKDHNVVPYVLNHQPTWPCCNCPKKKKCTIQS